MRSSTVSLLTAALVLTACAGAEESPEETPEEAPPSEDPEAGAEEGSEPGDGEDKTLRLREGGSRR